MLARHLRTGIAVSALLLAAAASATSARAECSISEALNTCKTCHELEPGRKSKSTGPSIGAVYGSKAGQAADYVYSDAIKAAAGKGLVWNDQTLDEYLADQKAFLLKFNGEDLPNKMRIFTHKDPAKRAASMAALKELAACK